MTTRWILVLTFGAAMFLVGPTSAPINVTENAPQPEPEVVVKRSETPGWFEVWYRGELAGEFTNEELIGDHAVKPRPDAALIATAIRPDESE